MSIYKKLLAVQGEMGTVKKSSDNPFYNSKFFDINQLLEVVKPVLTKHGIVMLQPLTSIEGKPAIKTILADGVTGEVISDITVIPENKDPQKMGGIISYFRRYALSSVLGMQACDDDAAEASGKVKKPAAKPRKKAGSSF